MSYSLPATWRGGGVSGQREGTRMGSKVQTQGVCASCRGSREGDMEAPAPGRTFPPRVAAAPARGQAQTKGVSGPPEPGGWAGSSQDGLFSGLISRSTSRMNRRHNSSSQGRATHCTATGSPTLFFMACRGHGHQDGRRWTQGPTRDQEAPQLERRGSTAEPGCSLSGASHQGGPAAGRLAASLGRACNS